MSHAIVKTRQRVRELQDDRLSAGLDPPRDAVRRCDLGARGQTRGNSGVYLQGLHEIQVLDSYGLVSQSGDCGAIYGQAPPRVNACRPPGQWPTYDILFHAPRFDDRGRRVATARVSVLQNGIWIHDDVEIEGSTTASMNSDPRQPGPIMLQDHGNPSTAEATSTAGSCVTATSA